MIYLVIYQFILVPPASMYIKEPLYFKYPSPGDTDTEIWASQCVKPLTFPHNYEYTVELTLPEMPQNMDMGVFMIRLILLHDGKGSRGALQESMIKRIEERPLMLRWKNPTLMYIRSLIFSIPRILLDLVGLNWFEEKQTLRTTMISREPFPHSSTEQCLLVVINNPKLNLYDSHIVVIPQLEGWRYFGYYWFYTSFFLGVSMLTSVIMSLIIGVYLFYWIRKYFALRKVQGNHPEKDYHRDERKLPKQNEIEYIGLDDDLEDNEWEDLVGKEEQEILDEVEVESLDISDLEGEEDEKLGEIFLEDDNSDDLKLEHTEEDVSIKKEKDELGDGDIIKEELNPRAKRDNIFKDL